MNKPTIYLAGGFYGDWNQQVKDYIGSTAHILDPRDNVGNPAYATETKYTYWDLEAINQSDIIFAFVSGDNPAIGVTYEIGYAKGKGIPFILVNEKTDERIKRYFGMCRVGSMFHTNNFEDGVRRLKDEIHQLRIYKNAHKLYETNI